MSNHFVFTYTVVIYNSNDYENTSYRLESGLLSAYNYVNAMEQLADYYDTDLTRIIDLAETDNEMIVLPANVVCSYARGEYDETTIPCDKWGNKLIESDNETATIDWNVQEATSI